MLNLQDSSWAPFIRHNLIQNTLQKISAYYAVLLRSVGDGSEPKELYHHAVIIDQSILFVLPAQGNQGQASRRGWLYMYSNEGKWKWSCRHNESSECSPNSIHSGVHNFKNTWDFHHNIILQMRPNRLYTLGCLGRFLSLHFFLSLKFAKIVIPVNLEHPILMAMPHSGYSSFIKSLLFKWLEMKVFKLHVWLSVIKCSQTKVRMT